VALAVAACGGSSDLPLTNGRTLPATPSCPGSRAGQAQCDLLVEKTGVRPDLAGWTPASLRAAYDLPSTRKGAGQIIAIVDAFDNPKVASDLAAYRKYFKIPPVTFAKYNQEGKQSNYPEKNKGWGQEIDLDVEMVSAICPNCTIYLIEARTNTQQNLYDAEKTATTLGASIISNSWGGYNNYPSNGAFTVPGITYVASAGDEGYGMQQPADYVTVVSVGGTVLSKNAGKYSETVWEDTGGGCSDIPKPRWQHDPRCTYRTGNDVSAVASNVAFYDTYGLDGWGTADGTSVAAPIIASVFALAGDASAQEGGRKFWHLRRKRSHGLHYVMTGQIANCPPSLQGTYLCTAGTNQFETYSSPAGWGTPNGIAAF
jgi:subtilase family serine protease